MTLVWKSGLNLQSPTANDPLLDLNTQPSLDLQFATSKTLDDRVSGLPLVNHQRDASSGKSAGTYVDSDGLIKTSPVNLLPYSDYSQTASTTDAQLEGVVAAPDGTIAARRYSVPSAGLDTINKIITTGTAGKDYTFSVWVRSTGTASEVQLIVGDADVSSVVQISTQWQRFEITKINNASSLVRAYVQLLNVGDEVEVWGAQLEEGTTATDYIPTTTTISGAPRFDHDPVTGESLGLLIEEERTNLLTYSEQFDQSAWIVAGTVSVVPNSALGPDGLMTADQITLGSTSARIGQFDLITTPGQTGTASVYLKNIDHVGQLTLRTGLTGGNSYNLNLSLTSEWVRYELTTTHNGTQNVEFHIRETSANPSGSFLVWGAQLEAGSFPTSYIPTTSSTVARAADLASITGTNFSSWFNPDASTVYFEGNVFGDDLNQYPLLAIAQPSSAVTNSIMLTRRSNAGGRFTHYDSSNVLDIDFNSPVWIDNSYRKLATAIGQSSAAFADSGSIFGTDTTYQRPSASDGLGQLLLGSGVGGGISAYNVHISRLTYYPYRLTDTTLQEITS